MEKKIQEQQSESGITQNKPSEKPMKTFRYYLDIDAKDRDDAQSQLEDMAGDGGSFGDLDCIEMPMPCETISSDVLKKFLNVKEDSDILKEIEKFFEGWDGWFCTVGDCGHTCGCDTGEMFEHLKTHTIEELEEENAE